MSEEIIDSFEKLRGFINNRKIKHHKANYQPVVIRALLENDGTLLKNETDDALVDNNDELDDEKTPQTPVYGVLERAKVIEPINDSNIVSLYFKNPTSDDKKELIPLCDEWIENSVDEREKLKRLTEEFKKNRRYFDPNRLEIHEMDEIREKIITHFTKEKISQMTIEEYVDGYIDETTKKSKNENFCSVVFNAKPFGSIVMPSGKSMFKVWIKKNTQRLDWNRGKYETPEQAFEESKRLILEILDAGEKFDLESISKNKLQRFFRSKILCIYFPEKFIQIHSRQGVEKIANMLKLFPKEEIPKTDFFELRQAILKYKKENPYLNELHIYDFSHVVWTLYNRSKKRKTSQKDSILDDLDQFEDEKVPKTQIQVLNKIHKNRGKNLASHKIQGSRKKYLTAPLSADPDVDLKHYMHNLVTGVYKPANSEFAQSIALNPKSRWKLEIIRENPTLKIRYDFEDAERYKEQISYMKKSMDIGLPVGIFFRLEKGKYKCLGLGNIISHEDNTIFYIESYGISDSESKNLKEKTLKEYDSATQDPDLSKTIDVDYEKLFTDVDFQKQYSPDKILESYQGEPRKIKIPRIIEYCDYGEWVIPDFQRFFDWESDMIKNFLNSIFYGYYVGSLLLWENRTEKEIGVIAIKGVVKKDYELRKDKIILDGQQRITSLYYAIKSPDYPLKGEKDKIFFYIDFGEFFTTNIPEEAIKIFSKELDEEDCYRKLLFPFNKLLSYKKWIRNLRNFLDENYSSLDLKNQILPLSEAIDQKLDYIKEKFEIPYVGLEDISLKDVVEIFKRINTTGEPLDVFDLLIAIISTHKIKLRKLWEDACNKYPKIKEYFQSPKRSTKGLYILQSMALSEYSKSNSCKPEDIQRIYKNTSKDKEDFVEKWTESLDFTNQAIELLENTSSAGFGVITRNWIPYEPVIPVLASLLRFIEDKKEISKKDAYKKISYWYWISVFSNAYSKSVDTKKTYDYNAMKKWIEKDVIPPEFIQFRNNFDTLLNLSNVKNKGGSIFRGILSLFALDGAKDWATDRVVLNQQIFKQNAVQVDHIFPKSKYKDDVYNESILNMTWLAKETNEWMKKAKDPQTYLNETIEKNFNNVKIGKNVRSNIFLNCFGLKSETQIFLI